VISLLFPAPSRLFCAQEYIRSTFQGLLICYYSRTAMALLLCSIAFHDRLMKIVVQINSLTCHTEKCTVEISAGRSGGMHAMYDIKPDDSGH